MTTRNLERDQWRNREGWRLFPEDGDNCYKTEQTHIAKSELLLYLEFITESDALLQRYDHRLANVS
jgi:hypothetical protein